MMELDIDNYMTIRRQEVDRRLDELLQPRDGVPPLLSDAMRYSILSGGKRFRPILLLSVISLFEEDYQTGMIPACAVEMIHAFSLIHDDLPCMDDDDMRRGKPTVHRKFDEATAVLAGDALLTEAFLILSGFKPEVPGLSAAMISQLASAAGIDGMIGGQLTDIESEGKKPTGPLVDYIHARKTAALISASARLGAMAVEREEQDIERISAFGFDLGLAFQIVDDVLDVIGDDEVLGKRAQKDLERGKVTYPGVFGTEKSMVRARELVDSAVRHLEPYGERADVLRRISGFVVNRVS
jgi:geranylgeranyl diphosphate synthase type II